MLNDLPMKLKLHSHSPGLLNPRRVSDELESGRSHHEVRHELIVRSEDVWSPGSLGSVDHSRDVAVLKRCSIVQVSFSR